MSAMIRDAYFALRALRRSPGFAAAATLTLALSVGATTAVFGVVDARPDSSAAGRDPDRLVAVFEVNRERGIAQSPPSGPNYWTGGGGPRLTDSRRTDRSRYAHRRHLPGRAGRAGVSANFFDVLGIPPALGRTFRPGEDEAGGARVIVLSYGMWQERFGGSRASSGACSRSTGSHTRSSASCRRASRSRDACRRGGPRMSVADQRRGAGGRRPESRQARYLGVIGRLRSALGSRRQNRRWRASQRRSHGRTRSTTAGGPRSSSRYATPSSGASSVLVLVLGAVDSCWRWRAPPSRT
jgi:hypothetical protein